jgi:putative permease
MRESNAEKVRYDRRTPPLFTAACLIIFIWGLIVGRPFILPVLIAAFLGFLMAPLHHILMKKAKLRDGIAVVISAIVFISPLAILGILLVQQGKGLVQDVPQLINSAQTQFQNFTIHNPIAEKLGLEPGSDLGDMLQKVSSSIGQGFGMVVVGLSAIADVGSQMILIFVFAILFLASRVHLRKSAEHILASKRGFDGNHLLDQATDLIQRFLVARMTIVVIIGVLATTALAILNVRYSIFLGTFFGLLTLVPAVGSLTGILAAVITALITGHSGGSALVIAIVLFAVSSLENYYLTPKMVGNRLNLSALTCFVGLFAGGLMWGVWGMFLSVPILGVLRIVFSAVPSLQAWGELIAEKTEAEPLDLAHAKSTKLKP